jgi:hypothetical protein
VVDVERMFVHVVAMEVMQVAVVEVVGMAAVSDGAMPAAVSMLMSVIVMD